MANILSAILDVQAPNVAKTVSEVEKAVDKAEKALDEVSIAAEKASDSLDNAGKSAAAAASGAGKLANPLSNTEKGFDGVAGAAAGAAGATSSFSKGLPKTEAQLKSVRNANFAFNQVLREAPAFAFSFQTGILGISNNLPILTDALKNARASGASTGQIFSQLGKQLFSLPSILSFGSLALALFGDNLFKSSAAAQRAKTDLKEFQDAVKGIVNEQAKEIVQVNSLIAVLKSETESRVRKLEAIKGLQRIQPEIFAGLKLEGNLVSGLDAAYKTYIGNLNTVIEAKIKQARLEQVTSRILELEGKTLTSSQQEVAKNYIRQLQAKRDLGKLNIVEAAIYNKLVALDEERSRLLFEQKELFKDLVDLSKGIDLKTPPVKVNIGRVKVTKDEIQEDILNAPFEVDFTPPPAEVKREATEFGEMFKKELEAYFKNTEVTDFNLLGEMNKKPVSFAGITGLNDKELAKINSAANAVSQVLTPAIDGMFDALARGENAFQAFAEGVRSALISVISKLVQTVILASILSAIFPGGVGNAKGFGDIFKGLLGFGGFRAGGGPVQAGKSYVVGERGSELFVPNVSGRIIPNGGSGSYGGGAFGGLQLSGRLVGQGRDLVAVIALTNQSQVRTG